MYLFIFDHDFIDGRFGYPGPGRILILPKAPMQNALITYEASVIFSFWEKGGQFKLIKNRYGDSVDKLSTKFLGIRLFDDGFFVSDKDLAFFLLKYQGLSEEKVVDFPLI